MPTVLDESTPTRDTPTWTNGHTGAAPAKSERPESKKTEDHDTTTASGVLDPDGKPWTSPASRRMHTATKMLPFAIAGIVGLAAVGTGYVMMARRRERDRSLKARVMRLLGSAVVRQIASGVGGVALGAATSMARSAVAERLGARKQTLDAAAPTD